jgi:hypothetical protein
MTSEGDGRWTINPGSSRGPCSHTSRSPNGPAAAPLIRYVEVDMAASLLVDLAVPVEGAPPSDERVHAGLLPAGDYVTLLFRGY